jgi:RimJ/RimL family protein N-acetyltransferase
VVAAGALREREQPVLSADGLVLRPFDASDADAVAAAFTDPAIQRWHAFAVTAPGEALEWIALWGPRWAAETDACWAVVVGAVAGRVALRHIDLAGGVAEVGYWMLPAARGQGIAARAVSVMTRWALDELALHRLELKHSVHNGASCRVADKSGYRWEGTLGSALLHADGWHDVHLHARLAGHGDGAAG